MTIEMLSQLVGLITGLVGLVSAGIAAYFAIKNFVESVKTKKSNEVWGMIMSVADAAMKEAEASAEAGETKKQLVMDTVNASCVTAGIDITDFITQLGNYIDDTIKFVNDMKAVNAGK